MELAWYTCLMAQRKHGRLQLWENEVDKIAPLLNSEGRKTPVMARRRGRTRTTAQLINPAQSKDQHLVDHERVPDDNE